MKELLIRKLLVLSMFLVISFPGGAAGQTVTNNHTYINVANDAGVKFNGNATDVNNNSTVNDYNYYGTGGNTYSTAAVNPSNLNNTYLIKADGGGINELKISTSTTGGNVTAVTTTSNNPSGSFYITNSGGRGFDNDIILAVSITGPISDNFSVNLKSSGYSWAPAAPGVYQPPAPTDAIWGTGINETFYKSDFLYGPQTVKAGTAQNGGLPLYVGQDTTDPSTAQYLMFVDLYVGNLKDGLIANQVDNGAVKVDFQFKGLDSATKIAFNAYGWTSAAFQGEGINWTNDTTNSLNQCGYSITAAPTDTTYPTAAITYSPTGPYKEGTVVTITATFSEDMKDSPAPMIDLSGAASMSSANMTKMSPTVYTYSYTVGSGDGDVAVKLSTGTDLDGNAVRPTPTSGAKFTIDSTPPTVFSFTPADGATDIDTGSAVTVTFSEPVDPLTIDSSTIYISGVSATLSYDAETKTATIVPSQPLANSMAYDVTVNGIKDMAGNTLSSPKTWAFTTTAAPDTTPPTAAISYSPAGPYKAGTAVTLTATFSEAMATSPIPKIALSGAATLTATEMTRTGTNQYTYLYTVGSGDGGVTVTLSNGTDLASTPNSVVPTPTSGATFSIDNTPPTVSPFTPANGTTNVDTGGTVTATFTESMDPDSITGSTFYINGVSGTVNYDSVSRTATLIPAQLATGTTYTVTVSGVKDLAGNVVSTPITWSFTTTGILDTTPPMAAISYSPTGPYKAGAVVTIKATFSEAMATSASPKIALSGAASLSPTDMTPIDATHYTYVYTVGSGDGDVIVTLSNGTDIAGNPVVSTPTGGGTFTIDNTSPTVSSFTPADGATTIDTGSTVTVTFSESMDPLTITATTLRVNGVSSVVTYNAVKKIATLTPMHLANGTTYSVTVSGVKDLAGNAIAADKTWTFNTVPLYGDLKGTGSAVSIEDALIALRLAAGLDTPTGQQLAIGDVGPLVNGQPHADGKIDISDVVVILMKVVGLVSW